MRRTCGRGGGAVWLLLLALLDDARGHEAGQLGAGRLLRLLQGVKKLHVKDVSEACAEMCRHGSDLSR